MLILPSEEEPRKEAIKAFIRQFSQVFVFLQASYLVSFSTPELPWDPPWGAYAPLSQDGSRSEGFWEEPDSLWAGVVLTFDAKEPFCACVVSPLSFT